jgi:hypothetical protein
VDAPEQSIVRRRPQWALLLPVLVFLLAIGGEFIYEMWRAWDTGRSWAVILPLAILGVLTFVAVPALALGHRIGWIMAVTITGWGLTFVVINWYFGGERYILMGLLALLAFLLHTPEMRTSYGVRPGRAR